MKIRMKTWKHYMLFIATAVGLIFLISYGISSYYDFQYETVTFTAGLIVLLAGLYGMMEGRSFGNHMVVPGNVSSAMQATIELERELQEIKRQGPYRYAVENRIMKFRSVPFALVLSGVISFGITYFIA
ncbi:hypothetical protein [Paenibacillus guangzhouensis]|uniref:hypothetical protein n=1 Tax=Paenibacillus guangzhouensis TaxID=1473112 RepID=UPI001266B134|nr:hypothetical protein [Paenibacillus guangzhouensis]